MKKQYGLMHIPDLTADETRLPAWYLAAEVDARIAELEQLLRESYLAIDEQMWPSLQVRISKALGL